MCNKPEHPWSTQSKYRKGSLENHTFVTTTAKNRCTKHNLTEYSTTTTLFPKEVNTSPSASQSVGTFDTYSIAKSAKSLCAPLRCLGRLL